MYARSVTRHKMMIYSKSFIRLVALFAAAMLLLCQTAAAALSHVATLGSPQAIMAKQDVAAPCHHDGETGNDDTLAHGCQDRCPARDASLDTAKTHIPAAHALLVTVLAVAPPISRIAVAAPRNDFAATATPPPLRLVYCRLLN